MRKNIKIKLSNDLLKHNAGLVYAFLFTILLALVVLVAWIFKPFFISIILAGVIASFFYPVYKLIYNYLKSRHLASIITTVLIAAILIVPLVNFSIYFVNKTVQGYARVLPILQDENFVNNVTVNFEKVVKILRLSNEQISQLITDFVQAGNKYILTLSTLFVKGTTNFILNSLIIFLTIYYLFVDGKKLTKRIMNLTPLPNKYDAQIFKTFREVSYSTILSIFAVALFQGIVGGIGFAIVGLPGFFGGIAIAVLSIVPYVGSFLVWGPSVLYLFAQGHYVSGIVLLVFGIIVSTGDNVVRAYLIKGKTKIHELIVFFSVIGGIVVFGFWGIVIGPLIIAMLFTVVDIYEKEFAPYLEQEIE